jgi:hypothetical protein
MKKTLAILCVSFWMAASAIAADVAPQDVNALKARAEAGEAAFQAYFGYLFASGSGGVPQNNEEAFKWYHKAADQGYVPAEYNLGVLYDEGRGVAQSHEAAYFWLSLAAASGGDRAAEYGKRRDEAGLSLTLAQVDELKKRIAEWRPVKEVIAPAMPVAAVTVPVQEAAPKPMAPGVVIPWFRLPPGVQKTINEHVGAGSIIGKVEKATEDGLIVYRAHVNKSDSGKDIVRVTESGKLLDVSKERE